MEIFEHNKTAYESVKDFFAGKLPTSMPNRCCVIHPTGTGKSYIALQLIADNRNSSILYVTSYSVNLILFEESVKENIGEGLNITYAIYFSLKPEELPQFDFIILDEFHRAGAPQWQKAVEAVIANNQDAKILGLSATPIRHLDNNRNMAVEMFNGNVVSEIPLHDALISGLLPMPYYTTCVYSFDEDYRQAEHMMEHPRKRAKVEEGKKLLEKARRLLENVSGLKEVFRKKMMYPKGRYIVFCKSVEHLYSMMLESKDWFSWLSTPPHCYAIFSDLGTDKDLDGQFEGFREDESDALRLLFCVDMLNEGTHLENIDGVIMLRPTESLNVYFQQLGRALTVAGEGKHPQIIDIVNNAASLNTVQEFWTGVAEEIEAADDHPEHYFDVWWQDIEIQKALAEYRRYMSFFTWDEYYEICRRYYEENGTISTMPIDYTVNDTPIYSWLVKQRREKDNLSEEQVAKLDALEIVWDPAGERWNAFYERVKAYYDVNGDINIPSAYDDGQKSNLFDWLDRQRVSRDKGILLQERIDKLDALGMNWAPEKIKRTKVKAHSWDEVYELCSQYYKEHGSLDMPKHYKMDGMDVSAWVVKQRLRKKVSDSGVITNKTIKPLEQEQIEKLEAIGMDWSPEETAWEQNYAVAKEFFEKHGHLRVTLSYRGRTEIDDGGKNLNYWIAAQRDKNAAGKLSQDKIDRLNAIGMIWNVRRESWDSFYEVAVEYYREFGNIDMPMNKEYHGVNLGGWLSNMRSTRNGRVGGYAQLTEEQIAKLDALGMHWNPLEDKWNAHFKRLKDYYDTHGSLDGLRQYDKELSGWVTRQKRRCYGAKIMRKTCAKKYLPN